MSARDCPQCGEAKARTSRLCYGCYSLARRGPDLGPITPPVLALRGLLRRRRLSMTRAALQAGITRTTVTEAIRGRWQPTLGTIECLARGLGLVRCRHCAGLGWTEPEAREESA